MVSADDGEKERSQISRWRYGSPYKVYAEYEMFAARAAGRV